MLVKAPERAIDAFKGGVWKTALAVCSFPLLLITRLDGWSNPWPLLASGVAAVIAAALLGGLACAAWASVRRWAYREVADNDFPQ